MKIQIEYTIKHRKRCVSLNSPNPNCVVSGFAYRCCFRAYFNVKVKFVVVCKRNTPNLDVFVRNCDVP